MKPGNRFLLLIFLSAAALLVASMVVMYRVGLIVVNAEGKMAAQLLVMKQLEDFSSALKDTESGQRGYLLSGEVTYLEPYTNGLSKVQTGLEQLSRLASNGDLPKENVQSLAALTQQKLAELEQIIQVRREKGLEAAVAIVRGNRGKEVMDDIRAEAAQMRAAEEAAFAEANRRASWATGIRNVTFLGAGCLNLAFLGWMFRKISREMWGRDAAVLEASREKELLATTLTSIGDGVIVTDAQGRVTTLNAEAARLTGWSHPEAQGQELPTVFRIINEASRQPVENPVEKVLRLGTVVGLANHTILISRSGKEVPIDDSAAPIRQPGGPIFGVVLVFRDFTEQKQAEQSLNNEITERKGIEHELREVHQELADRAVQLEKAVQERTAKLREMIAELEHVSYAIVHDMRSPLRAMQGFAELLEAESGKEEPELRRQYARRIMNAASRLDKLIQDTLTYNKAVLREMPLEPVDLSKLLRGLIESYPNIESAKADIHVRSALPVVLGNEALLTECFSNLLGNAVKFVAPGIRPNVDIRADVDNGAVRVWVEDNGIGIPRQAQQRLFGMFQRQTTDYEGTGIGLAIVKKVVERMGGRVGVESEPGKGSRFWVELHPVDSAEALGATNNPVSAPIHD